MKQEGKDIWDTHINKQYESVVELVFSITLAGEHGSKQLVALLSTSGICLH